MMTHRLACDIFVRHLCVNCNDLTNRLKKSDIATRKLPYTKRNVQKVKVLRIRHKHV